MQRLFRLRIFRALKTVCLSCCVLGVALASCLRTLDPAGAPCREDADCWSTHFCIQGQCQLTATPNDANEATPDTHTEPPQEPAPTEATPELEPAPTEQREPTPEVTPEPAPPDAPPPVGVGLYAPCAWYRWARDEERCLPGLRCVRTSAIAAFCLHDCTRDASICDTDEHPNCHIVNWEANQPVRACVKRVDRNQVCDESRGIFCHASGPQSAICQNAVCVPTNVVRSGEPCNPREQVPKVCDLDQGIICAGNALCTKGEKLYELDKCGQSPCPYGLSCVSGSNGISYCLRRCTADADCQLWPHTSSCISNFCYQINCKGDYDCKFLSEPPTCDLKNGTFVCLLRDPASFGKQKFAENCNTTNVHCLEGMRCLQFAAQKGVCTIHCRDDQDCKQRNPNYRCIANSSAGYVYCAQPCKNNGDCPSGFICYNSTACGPP